MMAKMKRSKLVALAEGLTAVGSLKGIKFAYAIAKNTKRILAELEDLAAGLKQSKRFKEYEKKRLELCEKMAKKDENGKAIKIPAPEQGRGAQEFVFESQEEFDAELEKLRDGYRNELDEREKLREQYEDALDEEIDFDLYMVKFSNVPKEITTGQLSGIIDLIEDDEEKPEEPEKDEEGGKKSGKGE